MTTFENPNQPDKKSPDALYQEAVEAIRQDQSTGEQLGEKATETLLIWQKAAEEDANRKNTSVANTEVLIQKVKIFMDSGRYDLAKGAVEEALEPAEIDHFFPRERLEELREMKKEIDKH